MNEASVSVRHYVAGGVYTKEVQMRPGACLEGHKHNYDHLSLLAIGQVIVIVDGLEQLYTGPTGIKIVAGRNHKIQALTPALWYCTHRISPEDETLDSDSIDASLIIHE